LPDCGRVTQLSGSTGGGGTLEPDRIRFVFQRMLNLLLEKGGLIPIDRYFIS